MDTWHFSTASPTPDGRYFVYLIAVDGTVRYIGKGSGSRQLDHARKARRINRIRASGETVKASRFVNRLAKVIREGGLVYERIVAHFANEADALSVERELIASMPAWQLWNSNEGGGGCPSDIALEISRRPEVRAKRAAAQAAIWSDPCQAARITKAMVDGHTAASYTKGALNRWSQPGYREKQTAFWRDPERRAQVIANQKEAANREERRASLSDGLRLRWKDEGYRRRRAQSIARRLNESPDYRNKLSEASKKKWADPEMRSRILAARATARAAKLAAQKGLAADGDNCQPEH